jgi:hypothetical protein
MRLLSTGNIVRCGLVLGLSMLGEAQCMADVPFTISKEFTKVGAPSLAIKTSNLVVFSASQLAAAQANNTIAAVINNAIQNDTTIQFPAGTYSIPAVLFISGKTNVVLQGAVDAQGVPTTTLNFTRSLTQLYGNNTRTYGSFGAWHGGGGLITIGTKHPQYKNGVKLKSQNIGIENFNITFNRTSYNRSLEAGYNGFYFSESSNCYAKNIVVSNFDNAFVIYASKKTTVKDIKINAIRGAHFGVVINAGSYNLIENVVSLSSISHPLSLQKTTLNVFKNATIPKGNGDGVSYRGGCKSNLFWNIQSVPTVLGASNGQSKTSAGTYGQDEFYWNCTSQGKNFSSASVPKFLVGHVFAYYGSQSGPNIAP